MLTCEECKNGNARSTILGHILCNECSYSNKYRLINKSQIKIYYKLSDKDISKLTSHKVHSFINNTKMILYHEKDVMNIFIQKHNNIIDNNIILSINDPHVDYDYIIKTVFNTINNNNLHILLNKYKLSDDDINVDLYNNFLKNKRGTKKLIESISKKKLLLQELVKHNLTEYVNHDSCTYYIDELKHNTENIYIIIEHLKRVKALDTIIKKLNLAINTYNQYIYDQYCYNEITINDAINGLIRYNTA